MLNKIAIPEHLPAVILFGQINVDSPATFSQVSTDIVLNQNNSLIPNNIWTSRITIWYVSSLDDSFHCLIKIDVVAKHFSLLQIERKCSKGEAEE